MVSVKVKTVRKIKSKVPKVTSPTEKYVKTVDSFKAGRDRLVSVVI